jgi:hypothetical protein
MQPEVRMPELKAAANNVKTKPLNAGIPRPSGPGHGPGQGLRRYFKLSTWIKRHFG